MDLQAPLGLIKYYLSLSLSKNYKIKNVKIYECKGRSIT